MKRMLHKRKGVLNMNVKLPIKTRVIEWCILNDRSICAKELADILAAEYPNEKSASVKKIDNIMDCYCRVGFMKPTGLTTQYGEPYVEYQITAAGKDELKFIPGHGNKAF